MVVAESPMPTLHARFLAVLCACLLGTGLITASLEAQTESSADQVIVKFTSQSEAGRALARMDLATIGNPTEDARLVELAQDFGERIGIPVRLESLTSGRELLLAVDRDALAAAVAARLRQREGVTSVEVADPTTGAGGEPASPRLTVGFEPGSPFAERLARESRVALEHLPGAGPGALDVQAEVQSAAPDHADLVLDLDALMTGLVERAKADPDVQYAQRNLRLTPYQAGAKERG
jgi:hypothetical protein